MVHLFTPALDTHKQENTSYHGRPKSRRGQEHVATSDAEGGSAHETDDRIGDDLQQAQADPAQTTLLDAPKSLKSQHLHVLNAILHKCMLDNDYVRPRRAFGILLRSELNGRPVDLRRKGLWAIGAEILLQSERVGRETAHDTDNDESPGPDQRNFPDESFQAAQNYYDRLSIQYPWRKERSSATSAQQFRLASLGMDVLRIQATADRDLGRIERENLDHQRLEERRRAIVATELASALSLDERLREMVGPPWDRDPHLLTLKGDVSLWLEDIERKLNGEEAQGMKGREHLASAKEYFAKAQACGAELTQSQERLIHPPTL